MNLRVNATNDGHFVLRVLSQTTWGDERLEFTFELGWASGKIELVCSKERLMHLQASLDKHREGDEVNHCFINEDGNLEINVKSLSTGLARFHVIAIPKMTNDDRIEFSFDGTVGT